MSLFKITIRDEYTKVTFEYEETAPTLKRALLQLKARYIGTIDARIVSVTDERFTYANLPETLFNVKED